ncbi:MAG: hypothetical protein HC884_18810, partial [Chloroflexaceae bacterium]|nr:hypothetical protein [Chloroflexaceae bacterium]
TSTATPTPPPTPTPTPIRQVAAVVQDTTIDLYLTEEGREEGEESSRSRLVTSVDRAFDHPLFHDFVSLSPDGRQVLYVTSQITLPMNATIWTAWTDGSRTTPIAHFSDELWSVAPLWSPDSSQIAYVTKLPGSAPDEGLQLWRMQRDGSAPTLVTQGGDFRPALFARIPQGVVKWSADSTRLEFRDRWSIPPRLFSVTLATGDLAWEHTAKEPDIVQQLTAQRATGGLPCPVPLFNQKNYSAVMFPCEMQIARAGCAVGSLAMVFAYYGIPMTPPALNDCMGELTCPLWWGEAATQCGQGMVRGVSFLEPFSYPVLEQEVAAGRPVVVLVTSYGTHFVVVTGGSGQEPGGYRIHDPVDGSSNRTLARYADRGWNLEQMYRYEGQPACPDAADRDPDVGSIAYGQYLTGTIDPAGDTDDFFFSASAGDHIEIQVREHASQLDPFVVLYAPDETLLALDDDRGGNNRALLHGIIPAEGRYRIRVQGYGNSSGGYVLALSGGENS